MKLRKRDLATWLIRIGGLAVIWIFFIRVSSEYQFPKDEGALYWYYVGSRATLLVLGVYIFIDYVARKRGWNEKSLWRLWISVVVCTLITSYVWIPIVFVFLFIINPIVFFILFGIYALIFGFLIFSIKCR